MIVSLSDNNTLNNKLAQNLVLELPKRNWQASSHMIVYITVGGF